MLEWNPSTWNVKILLKYISIILVFKIKKGSKTELFVVCIGLKVCYIINGWETEELLSLQFASGYADGSIRIWDCDKGTCETTLNGHKGAVTALRYNKLGSLLASGSKDNDVILWDVVGEAGLFRLRGHRDQVLIWYFSFSTPAALVYIHILNLQLLV